MSVLLSNHNKKRNHEERKKTILKITKRKKKNNNKKRFNTKMLNEKMLFIRECSHSKCGDACTAHNVHTISRLFVPSNKLTGTSFQSFFVKIHLIKTKEYSNQSGRRKKCYIRARALIYRSMKWYKISKINARFYGQMA